MATTRYLNLLLLSVAGLTSSTVVISEVADKGSSGQCGANNEDWVELHNTGSGSVSLVGWKLHDDKGPSHSKAFTFPSTTSLAAGEYLVLCTRMGNATTSPQFKIGGDDTVTLLDASGAVVSSSGALQDLGEVDIVWAYNAATSSWRYTSTPTPGQANVFTDSWPAVRARLAKQHDDGEAFFEASSVLEADRLPPVVEIRMTLSAEDWAYQQENVSHEVYKPFTAGLTVTSEDGSITHATLTNGGRARPRGMHRGSNAQFYRSISLTPCAHAPVPCLGQGIAPWPSCTAWGTRRSLGWSTWLAVQIKRSVCSGWTSSTCGTTSATTHTCATGPCTACSDASAFPTCAREPSSCNPNPNDPNPNPIP